MELIEKQQVELPVNILLLTIDCLRADHLSCLGYSNRITPTLDNLAKSGILFGQAVSTCSWTPGSFISIFTSTYPLMYGGKLRIFESVPTFTEALKTHGYNTAAFHSNPWLSKYYGYNKGFDFFEDDLQAATANQNCPYASAEVLNEKAISWIAQNKGSFFLWLHYMDAHEPNFPPVASVLHQAMDDLRELSNRAFEQQGIVTAQETAQLMNLYAVSVNNLDKAIGDLLDALSQAGKLDNTYIIIASDHGQQFMEHGHIGHGTNLYEELIHVPLIIAGPGIGEGVVNWQASLINLAPTILDLAGIQKPSSFMGNSFFEIFNTNRIDHAEIEAISETDSVNKYGMQWEPRFDISLNQVSLRTNAWKYIYTQDNQDELYNLANDPKEMVNLIRSEPEIALSLKAKIMAHIRNVTTTPVQNSSI